MKKLKKRWTLEDDDNCGGQGWTVVFLVVLVVGVEEGVTQGDRCVRRSDRVPI